MALSEDVTEQHEAKEALNKARSELAHVARVTTLSALTASIAHEVNQPLSGIVTNASTCLRMLDANPPNVEGARETARRTIRDGNRASEVITRLRALFSKKNAPFELFDLNEAAKEVIALSAGELQRNRVILQTDLASELPTVLGDRIQIQQVILNLIRNGSDAMSTVDDRSEGIARQDRMRRKRRGPPERQRFGNGYKSRNRRETIRSLPYDEGRGHGNRAFRQPLHHGKSSRPSLGNPERRSRRNIFIFLFPCSTNT